MTKPSKSARIKTLEDIMSSEYDNLYPRAPGPELAGMPARARDSDEAQPPDPPDGSDLAETPPVLNDHTPTASTDPDLPHEASSRIETITAGIARFYGILPIGEEDGKLVVACAEGNEYDISGELRALLGYPVRIVPVSRAEIEAGLRERYGLGSGLVEGLEEAEDRGPSIFSPQVQDLNDSTRSASVVSWVNEMLLQAYKDRATDVHFEPYEEEFRVRYRIDGILYDIPVPSEVRDHRESVTSRIKVMANLDLGEKRLPQDGRIKARVGSNDLDLRISVLPTLHGEAVDVRLLDKSMMHLGLGKLGLSEDGHTLMNEVLQRPFGVILVSGPTGSGKTTTLYASLCRLRSSEKKILTIEDPIEYELDGITQIQVSPPIGLTFSTGLRSMLRHDPDIMMVGEVRDAETAQVTVQVALTGHLVFSTVHTNDAASAIARLLNMGIEPYLLASCLQCIVAQRLVRVLCPHCKREVPGGAVFLNGDEPSDTAWEPVGCEMCKFIGYRGRTGIYEIIPLDDEIRDLVLNRVPAGKIKEVAVRKGLRTLRQAGARKVAAGITSLAEVLRVTQEDR
jgi:type II secretory ATPase GspE/PulE/Tfp pilus assembly ATPase PilB-like protein